MRDNNDVAASLFGGDFLNFFRRPRYQGNAVKPFLENLGDQYAGLYRFVP